MAFRPLLSLLAAASAGLATPLAARDDSGSSKGIEWAKCKDADVPGKNVECATLDVPLDYTDPDCEKLSLSLAKVPAAEQPSKGTILMNFGGPGHEARESLGSGAPLLLNMTGGHHDLVAFDPRGTGETMPISCFTKEEDKLAYKEDSSVLYDESDETPGDLWENAGKLGEACGENMEGGELVGTAFVARDLMEVVDALDEDGKLRYWGISYGSVLGMTVANMFPDRMDKVVLDGVANAENYYHGFHIDADQMAGADDAWLAILGECIDVGDKCPLSDLNSTATELADTIARAADRYRDEPLKVDGAEISYSTIKTLVYMIVKEPLNIADKMVPLRGLVTGEDLEDAAEVADVLSGGIGSEAQLGIACSDKLPRADSPEGVQDEVDHMLEVSEMFGGIFPPISMACAQWPFEARERKPVDGEVKTPNPVLFIGNTHDAATAVDSAYKMSESFPGSVVVEQKGFGHGSIAQKSKCTWKAMSDYFVDGVLPDGNIKCDVDAELFK